MAASVPLFGCFFVGQSYPIYSHSGFHQVDAQHWVMDVCSTVQLNYWELKEIRLTGAARGCMRIWVTWHCFSNWNPSAFDVLPHPCSRKCLELFLHDVADGRRCVQQVPPPYLSLFLMQPKSLDPSAALGLYLKLGSGDWLYRGCIHNGHPTEVMPLQVSEVCFVSRPDEFYA